MRLNLFGGKLSIHLITFPVLVFMVATMGAPFALSFVVAMLLHEAAHLLTAAAFRVKIYGLECTPFGCTAKTAGFAFANHGAEAIMAAAGPAMNVLLACIMLLVQEKMLFADYTHQFIEANIGIAAVNLLPVFPMDGGRILGSVLAAYYPAGICNRITGALGVGVGICIFGFGIWQMIIARLNISVLLVGIFMVYSGISQYRSKDANNMEFWMKREQQFLKKGIADAHVIAAHKDVRAGAVLPAMHHRKYNMICVVDDDLALQNMMGEGSLQEAMLKKGAYKKLSDL